MTVAKKVKASVRARVKLPNFQTGKLPAKEERVLVQPLAMASTLSQPLAKRTLASEFIAQLGLQAKAARRRGALPNIASCCIEAFARQGKHSYRLLSVVVMTFLVVDAQRLRFPASWLLEAGQVGRRLLAG